MVNGLCINEIADSPKSAFQTIKIFYGKMSWLLLGQLLEPTPTPQWSTDQKLLVPPSISDACGIRSFFSQYCLFEPQDVSNYWISFRKIYWLRMITVHSTIQMWLTWSTIGKVEYSPLELTEPCGWRTPNGKEKTIKNEGIGLCSIYSYI